MHITVKNLLEIENRIKVYLNEINIANYPNIIAVSKTFKIDKILPLIKHGHTNFGENKVQEAVEKWSEIKKDKSNIKLHLIGNLQTNKVKFAVKIFDYIHSLDSIKLAKKIADEQVNQSKKVKIFIQVNLANETQKAGISIDQLDELYNYSKSLNLNIIGLMCIPPESESPNDYFRNLKILNDKLGLKQLSMGMSADFMEAVYNQATYIRVGSNIFGARD